MMALYLRWWWSSAGLQAADSMGTVSRWPPEPKTGKIIVERNKMFVNFCFIWLLLKMSKMFVKLCFICLLFLGGLCSLSRSCTSSSTRASFPSVAPAGLERDVTDSIYYKDVLPRLYLHLNNKIQFELSVERAKRNFEKPQKVRSHPRPRDDDDDNERKDDREMMRCASLFLIAWLINHWLHCSLTLTTLFKRGWTGRCWLSWLFMKNII